MKKTILTLFFSVGLAQESSCISCHLELDEDLIKGVYIYGFREPSKIQINGIKAINSRNDCIIQSQSGTGKTASFALPILENLKKTHN